MSTTTFDMSNLIMSSKTLSLSTTIPMKEQEQEQEQEQIDPFSLVADELSIVSDRLRSVVHVPEVPECLATATDYFFKVGLEGKRFRPTILLLMATTFNMSPSTPDSLSSEELRERKQRISMITEMIHVATLLHDDVLDDADTRRGIDSLNSIMGNKLAILAGDFLLSRACVCLHSLRNIEVAELMAEALQNVVTGETMQMQTGSEQRFSMEYYMRKTYNKTASLMSNSCKSLAILMGQTTEVSMLAYDYGKNWGLAYQLVDDVLDFTGTTATLGKGSLSDIRHGIVTAPILFAIEEFPELQEVMERGIENPDDIDLAIEYLGRSQGIQRTMELATEHANLAAAAINSLPESDDNDVKRSRQALVDLTLLVITRTKYF